MSVKLIGLSFNSVDEHLAWIEDISRYSDLEGTFPFPLISADRAIATEFGMLDGAEKDADVSTKNFQKF